jgi:hypothetical protein
MNNRRVRVVCFVVPIACLWLAACASDPADSGPKQSDLQRTLATNIPAYYSLEGFHVEASQNVGDRVRPVFKVRFKAVVQLNTETFEEGEELKDALILVPSHAKGDRAEIYGVATSTLKAGSWKTIFDFDNDPISTMGKPRSFYLGKQTYIKGSADEATYRNQLREDEAHQQQEAAARQEALRLAQLQKEEENRVRAAKSREEQMDDLRKKWDVKIPLEDFIGKVWEFGRADGSVIATGVRFLPDGRIDGYSYPNESRWGPEPNALAFYSTDGRTSTRFTSFTTVNGAWTISGPFLLYGNTTHVLREMK